MRMAADAKRVFPYILPLILNLSTYLLHETRYEVLAAKETSTLTVLGAWGGGG
jgi:hypothetical protein